MIKQLLLITGILTAGIISASNELPAGFEPTTTPLSFTENKGQIHDQDYRGRPDVLFSGSCEGMNYHLRNNGISYQLSRVTIWSDEKKVPAFKKLKSRSNKKFPAEYLINRIDITWLNARSDFSILNDAQLPGYSNFYGESCPDGALNVRAFSGVTYKNIYEGIDLHYYSKDGSLKYDFIVAPHAGYSQIQMKVEGADRISMDREGALILETPLGNINEGLPVVFQDGRQLPAHWTISGDVLGFEIEGYDPALPLLIDPPVRAWGTYYGGSGNDFFYATSVDLSGNVYGSGYTSSINNIATSGSHQVSLGAQNDACLVKFSNAGVRLWSTYYGGQNYDEGFQCATGLNGDVYLSGMTEGASANVIATPGSYQNIMNGFTAAFLVKFNSAGVRQWGTYYGGDEDDYGYGCATDGSGNVYLSGEASSTVNISSPGAHQVNMGGGFADAFLVKFNGSGTRLWGTYYGGAGYEQSFTCSTDTMGNVFLTGLTESNSGIATGGAHLPNFGGGFADGFCVKFNSSGTRLWGTYIGGTGEDLALGSACDQAGNVYVAGFTESTNAIALNGFQNSAGGGIDGFINVFDGTGVLLYGTYYGGSADDYGIGCAVDTAGNFYLSGFTEDNNGTAIVTPSAYQTVFGGGFEDAFLVKFQPLCACPSNGQRDWGTYYGGADGELAFTCVTDNMGAVYMVGGAGLNSGAAMSSPGSHQQAFGGGQEDAFLVKFSACSPPVYTTPVSAQTICVGGTLSLTVSGSGNIEWFASPASTLTVGYGSVFVTPTFSAGTYILYAEDSSCPGSRVPVTFTFEALPQLTVSFSNSVVCAGQQLTITGGGAQSYSWSAGGTGNAITVTAVAGTEYTVRGTGQNGCASDLVFTPAVDLCTGLKDHQKSNHILNIFPNPGSGEFTIITGSEAAFVIRNALGQEILSGKMNSGKNNVDLKAYPDGIYIISIGQENIHNLKIIKTK